MLIVIGRVSKEMCRHEQNLSNVFPNLFPTVQSCDLLVRLEELRSSFTEHDLSLTLQRITYYAVFLFVKLSALHNVFRETNTKCLSSGLFFLWIPIYNCLKCDVFIYVAHIHVGVCIIQTVQYFR